MSDTKRPHFVPVCYLNAWADGNDQVCVRRRGSNNTFTTNTINVAVEADIYGRGEIGQQYESIFGKLEGGWPSARADLVSGGGEIQGDTRDLVALFAAMQIVRTREHRAQAQFLLDFAAYSSRRPVEREDVRVFLTERHLKFAPSEAELDGAWTIARAALLRGDLPSPQELMAASLQLAVTELAPRLGAMTWTVEHCRKPLLLTSDRPVMNWRRPTPRDNYEGIGIETAEEVRLPLTGHDLLVMRRLGGGPPALRVEPRRFERVSADVAAQCHEFIAGPSARARYLRAVPLFPHRPVLRFNQGRGFERLADGTTIPTDDVVHSWVPTRAAPSRRSRHRLAQRRR